MRKTRIDEHRAAAELREHKARPQLYLVLDNIRSLNNVGTMFRLADGFGVRKIYLCGITPQPPRPEIAKISLGAEKTVEYEWMEDPVRAVVLLREAGIPCVAAEQTDQSVPLMDYSFPDAVAIVLGHETVGVDGQVLSFCQAAVEIPMFGAKHSHNVSVAAAVLLYEVRRQWLSRGFSGS
ncbi:MAG: RNA methyltransferase [Planctomycetota bacterium]